MVVCRTYVSNTFRKKYWYGATVVIKKLFLTSVLIIAFIDFRFQLVQLLADFLLAPHPVLSLFL